MAKTFKILHTADWHLETKFNSFPDPEVRERLRSEHFHLLRQLETCVREEKIDLVMIAGDLFDNSTVQNRNLERVKETFASLAPCKFHICAGNHDPYYKGGFWDSEWPENVQIVQAEYMEESFYYDFGLRIDSRSFPAAYASESLLSFQEEGIFASVQSPITILMMHGDFLRENGQSDYNPMPKSTILGRSYDYIALGHIHLAIDGDLGFRNAKYSYCGAPQGRGFDELGQGRFRIGTYTLNDTLNNVIKPLTWENYYLDTRAFLIKELDVTEAKNEQEIEDLIEKALEEWQESTQFIHLKKAILRIVLVGRPDLHYQLDTSRYEATMKARGYFYLECKDKTKTPIDMERLSALSGFGQSLNAEIEKRLAKAKSSEEKEAIERALDIILLTQERLRDEN